MLENFAYIEIGFTDNPHPVQPKNLEVVLFDHLRLPFWHTIYIQDKKPKCVTLTLIPQGRWHSRWKHQKNHP